jgi:hypothetical protein
MNLIYFDLSQNVWYCLRGKWNLHIGRILLYKLLRRERVRNVWNLQMMLFIFHLMRIRSSNDDFAALVNNGTGFYITISVLCHIEILLYKTKMSYWNFKVILFSVFIIYLKPDNCHKPELSCTCNILRIL